ncbi:hypothetical protein BGX26_012444 [Mortierella sp. AD094]|nr:hypothetical protein BGX26_012444 [Mortierella sp. AD094]
MTIIKAQEEPEIEALRKELEAVQLELRNTKLDLIDTKDDLESTQADLDAVLSSLVERELELENTKLALANSEYARQVAKAELDKELSSHAKTKLELQNIKDALVNCERARQEANHNRVLPRPPKGQEVFAVLKFQKPQSLPVGGFRIFTQQRKTIDGNLKQFIADNPELDAVEIERLRFDPSPRGENVIQHMRRDKDAPTKLTNRSFVLKDHNSDSEEVMIEYVTKVFTTYTQDSPVADDGPKSNSVQQTD